MTEPLGSVDIFPPAANYTYLDAASVGLMHKGAAKVVIDWQQALADRGTVAFDERAELEIFDGLHQAAARLYNAEPEDIAVASSETTLMSSLAWAVMPPAGSNIVATPICHPATIYPWVRVAEETGAEVRWAAPDDLYVDPERVLDLIDENTAVVCLSHAEYSSGQLYDLAVMTKAAHRNGALMIADTTQSAGQVPIDVKATGIDAALCSTYKWLCGPFGTGFMYVAPALQKLNPGLIGWRTHKDMWEFQADRCEMPDNAKRFEFSTMAYGMALGATVAVDYLNELSAARIAAHNRAISDQLMEGLEALGASIVSPRDPAERSAPVAARFPGHDSARVAAALKEQRVVASLRLDFLRFSPHIYNGSADIERALEVIGQVVR